MIIPVATKSYVDTEKELTKKWAPVRLLLDEVETHQARVEPDEIMDINHDGESKFEKRERLALLVSTCRTMVSCHGEIDSRASGCDVTNAPELDHPQVFCKLEQFNIRKKMGQDFEELLLK
ncbi:hypothetical protein TNCV_2342781 [Trichonephila clavipes]|nr:hypothetical protein TNCV_2342781 [Trichonephila clavipes]